MWAPYMFFWARFRQKSSQKNKMWALHGSHVRCSEQSEQILFQNNTYGPLMVPMCCSGLPEQKSSQNNTCGPNKAPCMFFPCKFQLEIQNWALHWSHMHCSGQSEYISSQNNTYGPLMGTIFVVALCVVLGYLNRSHPRTTHVGPVYVFFFFLGKFQIEIQNNKRGLTWVPYALFWAA